MFNSSTPKRLVNGAAFLDAPNVDTILYHSGLDRRTAVEAIDLARLRRDLVARYGGMKCHYVRTANGRDLSARAAWLARDGWRLIEARHANMINRDPADVFIIDAINGARSQLQMTGSRVVVVASNDHAFADPLRAFAADGGHVAVFGFVGCMAQELRDLAGHPRCEIRDLRPYISVWGGSAPTFVPTPR